MFRGSDVLLPVFVCCLNRLLNVQLRCGLLVIVECAETGGGGLDEIREARLQDLLRE